jgi:hypothetical protein
VSRSSGSTLSQTSADADPALMTPPPAPPAGVATSPLPPVGGSTGPALPPPVPGPTPALK